MVYIYIYIVWNIYIRSCQIPRPPGPWFLSWFLPACVPPPSVLSPWWPRRTPPHCRSDSSCQSLGAIRVRWCSGILAPKTTIYICLYIYINIYIYIHNITINTQVSWYGWIPSLCKPSWHQRSWTWMGIVELGFICVYICVLDELNSTYKDGTLTNRSRPAFPSHSATLHLLLPFGWTSSWRRSPIGSRTLPAQNRHCI